MRQWQWCANRGSVSQVQAAREIADITAAIAALQSPLWTTENHSDEIA
jgi:hypothetical protein